MKGIDMKIYIKLTWLMTLLLLMSIAGEASPQTNRFKLQPGAEGTLCMNCHTVFQDKLKSPFLHTPLKTGGCTACHNPHASTHGKLLTAKGKDICLTCHGEMIPERARSVHKVVAEGNCTQCHEPHGGKNRSNLLTGGNELCFGCHKEFGEALKKAKFKHSPVEKGCTACHNPHGSAATESLLKDEVPGLCLKCHNAGKPAFARQHMNYPVGKSRCTGCHNPHGSNRGSILYDTVHKPVANKMCSQCHAEANAPSPFAVKKSGFELCKSCHSSMVNDMFNKSMLHLPLADAKGCLNCHNPHASPEKSLLIKGGMLKTCGSCHADTIARQERSKTKHPPIQQGMCASCHSPHSSDNPYLLQQKSIIGLCGTCHEWQKHSTHPVGEKVIDPRNKNLYVQCLSCHRAHGNENKAMVHFTPVTEMCTQCHVKFRR